MKTYLYAVRFWWWFAKQDLLEMMWKATLVGQLLWDALRFALAAYEHLYIQSIEKSAEKKISVGGTSDSFAVDVVLWKSDLWSSSGPKGYIITTVVSNVVTHQKSTVEDVESNDAM